MLERLGLVIWWTALFLAAVLILYGLALALSVGIAAHGIAVFFAVIVGTLVAGRVILYILSGY